MLPLRFPNSGIRAKAARWGSQPQLAPMQGRPPTARSRPRPAVPARGDSCAGVAPTCRSAARGGSNRPHARPAATSLKGRQPPAGIAVCSVAPAKGVGCRAPTRGYRPWLALSPAARVAAPWQGGCQRARAIAACARVVTAA
ncbi:hypothetical protein B296_00048542 [Ensete ventricosum]|uniref:Uncharacterized protein n=1 Tax=Ensete ventricosum TaxID=4639 RepID=A0A426X7Y1_ENSVE|nr:hypothetical protein B296_00048542 [Ensete ventricosum]